MIQKTVGRYNLIEEIGKGGMGTVYRALDTELSREVAVKVLSSALSNDETFVARFQREARTIAQLEHPHIIPIYDVGEANGFSYIVMRLLEGGTLRDKSQDEAFTTQHLFKALTQVSAGLDYAHEQNIIHRDIKPSNILFDQHGIAYISDFGIAKSTDSKTQLTSNHVLGTPAYMSPEQFSGGDLTGKSDEYSLAVIAYEMLVGMLPFEGNTLQMMYKHVHEAPDLSVFEINDAHLIPILVRALAKKPEERYGKLAEFADKLSASMSAVRPQVLEKHSTQKSAARLNGPITPVPGIQKPPRHISDPSSSKREKKTRTKIQKGAGGTESKRIVIPTNQRKWLWVVPLVLVLLLGGYFSSQFIQSNSGQAVMKASPSTILQTSSNQIEFVGDTEKVLLEIGRDLKRVPSDGVFDLATLTSEMLVRTGADPIRVVFQNDSLIDLASNSSVKLDNVTSSLYMDNGELVAYASNDGNGWLIENLFGAQVVLTRGSLVGIISSEEPYRFDVSCLVGDCKVKGDVGGKVSITAGDRVQVGLDGKLGAVAAADYAAFSLLSNLAPTPTPTLTPTPEELLNITGTTTLAQVPKNLEKTSVSDVDELIPTATSVPTLNSLSATKAPVGEDTPRPTVTLANGNVDTPSPTVNSSATPAISVKMTNPRGLRVGGGVPIQFENGDSWGIGEQRNGSFTTVTERSQSGNGSGRLNYAFGTDGNDFVVFLQLNDVPGEPNQVSAWVYGDGEGHFANIWIRDNAGQIWQVPLGQVFHTGWRKMTGSIDVDQEWPWSSISGPDNGKVDYPIQFYAFVLDDFNQTYIGEGTIYVDNIEMSFSNGERAETTPTQVIQATENANPSTNATPASVASPTQATFNGDVGRVLYTSGSTLLTTDPSWSAAVELGTFSSNSCGNSPTLITGQSFKAYRGYFCALSGPSTCQSPDGQKELIINVQNTQMTVNLRAVGDSTNGEFIYSGSVDSAEGMQWAPNSQSFVWVSADTMFRGFVSGGYQQLYGPVYNPIIWTDSQTVLYRKPVGPGVNDVWVANLDGSGETNITNNASIDKKCAVWILNN